MRFGGLGGMEWLIILAIVVLIFGVGKIADVGPAVGKAISGFRKAVKEEDMPENAAEKAESLDTPESEQKAE
jgi:sec-independent protein translocase protein TatA